MAFLLKIAVWIFEFGLCGLLLATLVYARRLDRSIVQMRADHAALQALIDQIGASIAAAIAAADRLKVEASQHVAALEDACAAAATSTRRLDELISQATLVTQPASTSTRQLSPSNIEAAGGASASSESTTQWNHVPRARAEGKPSNGTHRGAPRRPVKAQSRTERDLARMLLDAS